jgi:hypothetical protein
MRNKTGVKRAAPDEKISRLGTTLSSPAEMLKPGAFDEIGAGGR